MSILCDARETAVGGDAYQLDLSSLKQALSDVRVKFRRRFLRQSSKWCGQMLLALDHVELPFSAQDDSCDCAAKEREVGDSQSERDRIDMAYDYLQCGETDRAAHVTEECSSDMAVFLHLYSRYLAAERRNVESTADPLSSASAPNAAVGVSGGVSGVVLPCAASGGSEHCSDLCQLRLELEQYAASRDDPFISYLHGVVLHKLALCDRAVLALCAALKKEPLLWPCWLELASLIREREQLECLDLPSDNWSGDCAWMKLLFTAHVYLELQMNAEAMQIYDQLEGAGLHKSSYIQVQKAIGFQNLRQVDEAIELFKNLSQTDPCRLENMDAYSNLLFVKGLPIELCALAHRLTHINKYSVETCCVVGNYYSLKNQHEKAILYFQRALKVCPSYLAAWTLMGHEYLELKNTNAAIQCYRQAIELNQQDYRAWYGLGQTYEILKMPLYCQYYYQRAHRLRPNDSRMLMAMGESYEKLDKLQEAKRCYWKAHSIGDIEGVALLRLARLFERLGEVNRAAAAYSDYLNDTDGQQSWDEEERALAHRFMANFLMSRGQLDAAQEHATHCTQFVETREEAQAILRELAQRRCETTLDGGAMCDDQPVTAVSASSLGRLSVHSHLQQSNSGQMSDSAATPSQATGMGSLTPQFMGRSLRSASRRSGGRLSLPFSPLDFRDTLDQVAEEAAVTTDDVELSPSESSHLL